MAASLGVDAHYRLTALLDARFPLLGRMSDYYDDTSYAPEEVAELIAEMRAVETCVVADQELTRFAGEALEVLALALHRSCGVEVVAD
jgi:hypothetical protein